MSRFDVRSLQPELIDEEGISFEDWKVCLHELDVVNTYLGGHAITVEGVRRLAGKQTRFSIAEIGCGGGDNLRAIHRKFKGNVVKVTGIDINKACVDFAADKCREIPNAEFICSDYALADFGNDKPDIIFNSLFCHHFSDAELIKMLIWMRSNSRLGFFINDLQRHPVAYRSISLLTRLFSSSYLVKHDAPVSVARGFKRSDWQRIMSGAGISNYTIGWRWAFRYLVIVRNG